MVRTRTRGGGLWVLIETGHHMWRYNQVLCVLFGGKHAVTWRNNGCSCVVSERTFKFWGWGHVRSFVCVHVCCLRAGLWRGWVSSGAFQTSVTLTLMNHATPGRTCACGCEACLSKLMLLFTRDDPEGPGFTSQQKRTTPDMVWIFYWTKQLCLNALPLWAQTVDSWIWWRSFIWSAPWLCHLAQCSTAGREQGMQITTQQLMDLKVNNI